MSKSTTIERPRPAGVNLTEREGGGADLRLFPVAGSDVALFVQQPSQLRFYTSSLPGWLSLALRDHHGQIAGTRLTLAQAKALREALDLHIAHAEGDQS